MVNNIEDKTTPFNPEKSRHAKLLLNLSDSDLARRYLTAKKIETSFERHFLSVTNSQLSQDKNV